MKSKTVTRSEPSSSPRASIVGRRRKPGFIQSCNPSLVTRPPSSERRAHEIKWDGYRAQAHLDDGEVEIYTRAGNDWSATFFPITKAVKRLRASSASLDGEVVAMQDCLSDFHELRRQLGQAMPLIIYQVFDLLWLDGEDLRPLPLRERKARLAKLIGKGSKHLAFVECFETTGHTHAGERLQAPGGHRLKAGRYALPVRPLDLLAEDQM